MPQISELFVALGVKGSAQTIEALSNVRLNIGSISTTALAAQAAILGMAYALQQLTTSSTSNAQNIQNLATYLNISEKALQQWRWAAQQAGVSNQELDQSFKSIQDHIKDFQTKHNLPQGSAIFAQHTGFDFTQPFKADDIMRAAIDFARDQTLPQNVRESILESWGITPNEISQAVLGRFNTANLERAPLLSNGEINNLSNLGVQFSDLETKVQMFFSHFTAAHSKEVLTTITDMTNAFLKLATVLDTIATKLHLFDALDAVFKSWITIFGAIGDAVSGKSNRNNPLERLLLPSDQENNKLVNDIKAAYELQNRLDFPPINLDWQNQLRNIFDFSNIAPSSIIPNQNNETNQNTNINQNLYFQHPGIDHAQNQESHKYAIAQAYRMSSAQARTT